MISRSKFLTMIALGATVALLSAGPQRAQAADNLADLLIEASDGAALDNNRFDYDIIVQTVLALEGLGPDPDLGGATLLDVLSNPDAKVTVFVPRDSAFWKLARALGWDGKGGDAGVLAAITATLDLNTIRNVVKYHVVPERLGFFRVLFKRNFDTALPGASFTRKRLRLRDNEPDLPDPRLTFPLQLQAGKSVAHTITRVLIPVDL